jgi:hypothetical protein
VSRPPLDLSPVDEFEAALLDCIEEYRKGFLGSLGAGARGKRRTRAGYQREYICITEIHAALEKRGIKKARSTVARRVKEFVARERRAFEIGQWVDEMDDALESIEELAGRMNPEWHKEQLDAVQKGLSLIRQAIGPWAIDRARSADDAETLARLVRYSSDYFAPGPREDKPKPPPDTPPKLGIVN